MNFYLKYINPLLAILIFLMCTYAGMREEIDKPINVIRILGGGLSGYFFAKGIFCGLSIFLSGKVLEELKRINK